MLAYLTNRAFKILREYETTNLFHHIRKLKKYLCRRLNIKYRHYLMMLRYGAVADPYKIIKINPKKISKEVTEYPSGIDTKWDFYAAIIGGDWDKNTHTRPFEERDFYLSMKKHFENNVPWEQSGIVDSSHQGNDTNELLQYYYSIDNLYENIKKNGYQKVPRNSKKDPRNYNLISVHIGRRGDFIFSGSGNHRLSIAKILQIDEIPVRVLGRHKQWQKLRDEIHKNGLPKEHEDLRGHADLQDVIK